MAIDSSAELKEEVKRWANEKDGVEHELGAIHDRLTSRGMPGLKGGLVDKEGFPRADIDVHAIRNDRNRYAQLQNDLKELMLKIEQGIHALHAMTPSSSHTAAPPAPAPAPAAPPRPRAPPAAVPTAAMVSSSSGPPIPGGLGSLAGGMRPFAVIDEVQSGSPGVLDGLRVGDQVIRFGDVSTASVEKEVILSHVVSELSGGEGRPLEVLVMRAGVPAMVSVTPRQWNGRGLLGCHLRPF